MSKGWIVRVRRGVTAKRVRDVVTCAALMTMATSSALGCRTETPIEHAERLVRRNETGEAIAFLKQRLAAHEGDVAARGMLVRVYAWAGDLGAAEREVSELRKRLPNDPAPWIELGHAYELTHRFERALEAYDAAASAVPTSPLGPREGGMRAARWGETTVALPRLEEAVRRGANDAETFHALGLVRLHMHDYEGAKRAYELGLSADPAHLENLLGLASVAVVTGDAQGALVAYDSLLARRPGYAAAELGRAWALGKLGRKRDAERALDHATELGASASHVEKQRAALRAQ